MTRARRLSAQIALVLVSCVIFGLTVVSMRALGRYRPFADLMGDGAQTLPDHIGLSVTDAVVQGRANGRLRWQVAAKSVTFSRDRRQAAVNGISNGILYDPSGKPLVRLSAGRATYQTLGGGFATGMGTSLKVAGGIHAELLMRKGVSIETQSLNWDGTSNTLQTTGPVTAVLPDGAGEATGARIVANTKTGDFSLYHLHGRFKVPPEIP